MTAEPLRDGHERLIGDLRVSVTDRCNFRCQYCMPAEGLPWVEHADILRFEEIIRIVALLGELGVHDVRLTGGEPLVRRGFPLLVTMLAALDDVHELSLTTNGYLLARDAAALVQAGVDRFNVSVDSLQRDRFYELTRRDALPQGAPGPGDARCPPPRASGQDQRRGDPRLHRGGADPVRAARAAAGAQGAQAPHRRAGLHPA
ncbi:MAG: radical SAM protein [Solirubrobacteraceae bacterium]